MRKKITKMKSSAKSKIMILIALGIFSNLIFSAVNINNGNDVINLDNNNLRSSKVSRKIHIDGNSGWVAFKNDGNCTGSGNYTHPYFIEDLVIDGKNSSSCILIENSNVYFRIENCTLYNSSQTLPWPGLWLNNVSNGHIFDNNCSYNRFGIQLDSNCENNTIQGNNINNNAEYGINLYESNDNDIEENIVNFNGIMGINLSPNCSYNEIVNNTVNFNGLFGIHFNDNSTNNLILDNNCSHNIYGIVVRTPNNTISGNYIEYNSEVGLHFWSADAYNNTQNNNITRNFIYNNNYGIKFSIEVGGVVGGESALNIFEGNRISDNTRGFEIDAGCNDNLIFNNTFINNLNANAEDNGNNNNWNSSTLGNYWSDYSGKDANDDGIGDTPYTISGAAGSQDNYPIFWDPPIISIVSPIANATFQNTAPQFNISIEGIPVSMWYTIEGILGNFSFTELNGTINQNAWNNLTEGEITITFYAQDSEEEIGSISIVVIKSIPSTGGIPGYNLFFLLGTLSIVSIIVSKKIKKS